MQLSEGSLCVPYGWGSMCVTARNYFNGRGQNAPWPAGITHLRRLPCRAACAFAMPIFLLGKNAKSEPLFCALSLRVFVG